MVTTYDIVSMVAARGVVPLPDPFFFYASIDLLRLFYDVMIDTHSLFISQMLIVDARHFIRTFDTL